MSVSTQQQSPLVGGIEAGGTKFVCAIGRGPKDYEETRFPTTAPDETFAKVREFFSSRIEQLGPISSLGIGTFGPADIDTQSPGFGRITTTPKLGWSGFDFVGAAKQIVGADVPIAFDTDVNAAAWGEFRWGATRDIDDSVYLTIGTGIGGGVISGGSLLHGRCHPEIGHLRIPHDLETDPFPGSCPFHRDCLEGLASGPAMGQRWDTDPRTLPVDHAAWQLEADYLADALVNLSMTLSPTRIVLGGGVMDQDHLLGLVRASFERRIGGYLTLPSVEEMIVRPTLGSQAGIMGAFALAQDLT